jgi:osmotically-inducible protein OsmY
MIGAAVGAAILASTGGGYAYWAGYVGNRQGSVQNEINAELGSHGLSNIKVTVNHEWVASLAGTALNQSDKDQAFGLVSGHAALKSIVNEVQIESNAADVEKNLNQALAGAGFSSVPTVQLDKDLVATLHGSASDQPEKARMLALAAGVAGVKGVKDEIEIPAPETIPEPENSDSAEAAPPLAPPPLPPQATPPRTVDKAALDRELNARLRANGVSGVTGHVNPDMSVALSGTVRSADERDRALTIGGSLPGANGVRETIQVAAPQVARLAPPQALTQASPPQVAPQVPPSQAAAIDPSKLEGDINRALRSRDINSVTAQVNDDMSLTLKGSASAAEKERAMQLARQVRGIRGIKDKIFVVE